MATEILLDEWDLELTVDHVLRGQGSDPGRLRQRKPALVEIAEWALDEGRPLLKPVVLARELRVDAVRHERLLLEGGAYLTGPLVAQHLAKADRVVVMACTIGGLLEEIVSQVMPDDPLRGLALDGLGNAAIETLATQACAFFEEAASHKAEQASIPLSPGMVGWPVDPGQRQVFALLETRRIGLSLTSSQMMAPVKSLTEVLGFGREMAFQGRTCDFCSLKDTCRYQDHYSQAGEPVHTG
ncbi:MAG TPA: hypothetical protein VF498_12625 [Anaerolineales bacterium]